MSGKKTRAVSTVATIVLFPLEKSSRRRTTGRYSGSQASRRAFPEPFGVGSSGYVRRVITCSQQRGCAGLSPDFPFNPFCRPSGGSAEGEPCRMENGFSKSRVYYSLVVSSGRVNPPRRVASPSGPQLTGGRWMPGCGGAARRLGRPGGYGTAHAAVTTAAAMLLGLGGRRWMAL